MAAIPRLRRLADLVTGWLVATLARLLAATLDVEVHAPEATPQPVIYAFLHGQQLALLRFPRPGRTAAVVSLSRDGDLQARVLARLGLDVIRGSSSAGGAGALRRSLSWLAQGRHLALAVDGPRGPAGRCKPGVVWLSQRTRIPIVPVACASSSSRRLARTWDGFVIPAPFARACLFAGEPFRPWEKRWTEERKLTYLDAAIAELAARAAGRLRDAA
jgi:hypothetical protein